MNKLRQKQILPRFFFFLLLTIVWGACTKKEAWHEQEHVVQKAPSQHEQVEMHKEHLAFLIYKGAKNDTRFYSDTAYHRHLAYSFGADGLAIKRALEGYNEQQTNLELGVLAKEHSLERWRKSVQNFPLLKEKDIAVAKMGISRKNILKAEYLKNILTPFLIHSLYGHHFSKEETALAQEPFSLLFPEDAPALSFLYDDFANYLKGGEFRAIALRRINKVLKRSGYYLHLYLSMSHVNLFYIDALLAKDIHLPPAEETMNILLLKRAIPNLLPNIGGYAMSGEPDVLILDFPNRNEAYEYAVQFQKPSRRYYDKVRNLKRQLSYKDFKNKSGDEIAEWINTHTMVHEAKHKADYIFAPQMTRVIDLEVSAHLAQVIYSPDTFNSLRSAIYRIGTYVPQVNHPGLRTVYNRLLNTADAALKTESIKRTRQQVRSEVRRIYYDYRTIQHNKELPSLSYFERNVLQSLKLY
jgi:hypothetical protein